ncbi:Panacea domain-containing protein [Providencia rettgeri]|uniref:Panacea domain-containing protein n=1 Tax=Providencia sp. PROV146 TaxID=2949856 RepID=UPI00234ACE91|nr:type II toxin-antitoxin system antitoxin SocA domain-containing protein [Providencia sp. PROV146]
MAYSAVAVANAFIQRAMDGQIQDLSPMKLQKLMFYAQSWNLKLLNSPLIDDFFAKWQHGPVIPSLYHEVKSYGAGNITSKIKAISVNGVGIQSFVEPIVPFSDTNANRLMDRIVAIYGNLTAIQLSMLTHQPNTAWSKTAIDGSVISNEALRDCIS